MNEHGNSDVLLSVINLDRISGLEKIISSEAIKTALAASSKDCGRKCKFPNHAVMWVVLAMGLFTDLSIRQVYKACRRIRKRRIPAASFDFVSGASATWQRLGSQPLVDLRRQPNEVSYSSSVF